MLLMLEFQAWKDLWVSTKMKRVLNASFLAAHVEKQIFSEVSVL